MPRQIAVDDEMPRRRRSAKAVAIEPEPERGLVMRMLLHSPKDMVAGALAFAAVSAIVANALFLQTGSHPSPMFGSVVVMPAGPSPVAVLPRPRPAEASIKAAEPLLPEPKPVELKAADPLTNLVKATTAPSATGSTIARPPAPIPNAPRNDVIAGVGSHRVAAVQRVLTEYGYGQLKATGTIGADTQAAISRFEKDRKVPVTGQMSDRLVRELTAMTGRPID